MTLEKAADHIVQAWKEAVEAIPRRKCEPSSIFKAYELPTSNEFYFANEPCLQDLIDVTGNEDCQFSDFEINKIEVDQNS
jgi:hypothetical protein